MSERKAISDVDLIDCLRHILKGGGPDTVEVSRNLIELAIKEIEFLRSHAGAVTQGESFDDIAKRVGRQPKDAAQ